MMNILNIDHIVLTCKDIDKTIHFYTDVLGMKEISFGQGRKALGFGNQKINLHPLDNNFVPKALNPTDGSLDLCFIVKENLTDVLQELKQKGIPVIEGIVGRTGANGLIKSIYIIDPDGNLIELSNYEKKTR